MNDQGQNKITLLVYDISNGMAKSFSPMFLGKVIEGIYHTSIVVYGREYFYGGGICDAIPKTTPYGFPIKEIDLGVTEIPKELFVDYLKEIDSQYHMGTYHILNNNCNHFTNEILTFLTGNPLPELYLNQHKELSGTPLGQMILPMLEGMSVQNNQFFPQMFEGKK